MPSVFFRFYLLRGPAPDVRECPDA